ncbi:unnamed protein product, partial [Penicillium nalgiovense]
KIQFLMEFSIYETRSMPELDTAFTKDEHIEPPFDFDSMISTPSFLNANPAWTICHGTDQVMIAIVTKLNEQHFACPCTGELLKDCQGLFPSGCTMFSIPQIYTGMMKTSRESTLNGTAGTAILEYLDWDMKYSKDSTIINSAKIAKKLQRRVSVRTNGALIEGPWRYDLPLKSGTLVDLREVDDFWSIQVSYEDFSAPGVRFGDLAELAACLHCW